ncbi:MAG TPA: FCD domain-containing protein, partial [Sphingomonas sp.]|nr:FCD domain-containing protein [Sphingomonas sp.]
ISRLVERVEDNIANGSWKPGFRLPTERELEREFGIARNTLRKGLKRLEDAGKIVRYVGRGSFIANLAADAAPPPLPLLNRVVGASPTEVMEIRLALEPWAASLAAKRATAADLSRMRECLAKAEAAVGVVEFEIWDGQLHQAIIGAAKNELLLALYEAIDLARNQPEWMKLKERTVTPDRRLQYQREHGEIVQALLERNAEAASDAIRNHLLAVRLSLVGY